MSISPECMTCACGGSLGCGAGRENAPRSLPAAGINARVAASFARIFLRNAISLELSAIYFPSTQKIETGEMLAIRLAEGVVMSGTANMQFTFRGFSNLSLEILNAGGPVDYYKRR
jgi:3-isopropylmalate/(R)-2-methylmalate dehydratase small subunit